MIKARVSDHALVRYMQRVKRFDMDAVREEILTPDRIIAIENGCTSIKIDGVSFKVMDGVVVTVLD